VEIPSQSRLLALFEHKEGDETGIHTQLGAWMDRDPKAFLGEAAQFLKAPALSAGSRRLIRFLLSRDSLLDVLCDPGLTLEEMNGLTRAALQIDARTDVSLARKLAADDAGKFTPDGAARMMHVLAQVSNGNRLMPFLLRLSRQRNRPRARLQAGKMIGQARNTAKWIESRVTHSDPRMRANALESLWGIDSLEARNVMREASRDSNNRVAANALFALHCMGDEWAAGELFQMAVSGSPLFRASAAWAMGETGDAQYREALGRMMGDAHAVVRKRAFSALRKVRDALRVESETVVA
jgi:HEAT repeat protein